MQKKIVLYRSLFIIALRICFYNSLVACEPQVNPIDPTECVTGSNIPEFLQTIGDIGTCYSGISNAYKLGKNVNIFLNPSQERQYYLQNIKEQLKLIELRQNFINCLVENRTSTKKGSLGIPSQCEHATLLFVHAGAVKEVERLVAAFNKYTK